MDQSGSSKTLMRCIEHVSTYVQMIVKRIKIFEYVLKVICNMPIIPCGSRADGISGSESDSDFMWEAQGVTVISSAESPSVAGTHLIYHAANSHPGYCTISVAGNRIEDTTEFGKFGPGLWNLCFEGTNMLSPFLVKEYWFRRQIHLFSQEGINQKFEIHGPALLRQVSCERERKELDALLCLPIPWPTEAREWFERSKLNGWPSRDVKQKVKHCHCHLVATGHKLSPNQDWEWRFSFTEAERVLMWSFNPTQYVCITLLKLLFQARIKPIYPDIFPSFYLKTTMFWLLEEKPVDFWVPENIALCLKVCFDSVLQHITTKSLPHYFIPNNNLLDAKPGNELENAAKVLRQCDDGIENVWTELGQLLLSRKQTNSIHQHHTFFQSLSLSRHLIFAFLLNILPKGDQLNQMKRITSLCYKANELEIHEPVFHHLISEMEIYTALLRYMECGIPEKLTYETEAMHVLEKWQQIDFCSGRLNLASLMYATGQIEQALKITKDVSQQFDDRIVHYSFWSRNKEPDDADYTAEEQNLAFNETKNKFIALDFILLPEQTLVPVPETLSRKVLFVQPIFYSLYLQYLCILKNGCPQSDILFAMAKLTDFKEAYYKTCYSSPTYMADFIHYCKDMTRQ